MTKQRRAYGGRKIWECRFSVRFLKENLTCRPGRRRRKHQKRRANAAQHHHRQRRGAEQLRAALDKLDRYLNDATVAGLPWVRVIHGKGTGVLRRSIRAYLTGHPLTESIASGEGNGGDGVTVVDLK